MSCSDPSSSEEAIINATIQWTYPISTKYMDAVQPLIIDDIVYVAYDTLLAKFKLQTGDRLWAMPIENRRSLATRRLLFDNEVVFLNHLNNIKAYSSSDGQEIWHSYVADFDAIDLEMLSQNSTSLFLGGIGEILIIEKSSGAIEQRIPLDSLVPPGVVQTGRNPISSQDENYVYIPTGYYQPGDPATSGNVFCYEIPSGNFVWGFKIPWKKIKLPGNSDSTQTNSGTYGCAIYDDLVILPAGHRILALNRYSGNFEWELFFENDGFDLGLTVFENMIYVGSIQEMVYAINARTGKLVWQRKTVGSITTLITATNEKVYLTNPGGEAIWVLDRSTGEVLLHNTPPAKYNDSYLSPIGVGNNHIVVLGRKNIFCLSLQ